jgi:hypothetical protein
MAKSINFKNEVYWDSSSVVHNKKKLSDILDVEYCQLTVYGTKVCPSNTDTTITSFYVPTSYGGFEADTTNGRLVIPVGTKTIETSGMICGCGYATVRLKIVDTNGSQLSNYQQTGVLVQTYGNGYWKHALPNLIIELDETKSYYIYLVVSGYNQAFTINAGFGSSSFIQAKKIR